LLANETLYQLSYDPMQLRWTLRTQNPARRFFASTRPSRSSEGNIGTIVPNRKEILDGLR
jgi:hypothetical protein